MANRSGHERYCLFISIRSFCDSTVTVRSAICLLNFAFLKKYTSEPIAPDSDTTAAKPATTKVHSSFFFSLSPTCAEGIGEVSAPDTRPRGLEAHTIHKYHISPKLPTPPTTPQTLPHTQKQ